MPLVAFHTLGCKVNHYETEGIWQKFQSAGYDRVEFDHHADVYVINTCTVTNTGDKKVVRLFVVPFEVTQMQ
ncbi:MiaB family protein [Gracilibacillus boraciitolerans JCM 21714]|uniref:MiaB family protein n=1 Tax=Gracilibacillus boraciitolerans JCM 21714 TaxID=1298598 RepID=W4VEG3_9BACI|nr:MiaB family protein [Gracilibacillus boraciitolerans JCM 21714]